MPINAPAGRSLYNCGGHHAILAIEGGRALALSSDKEFKAKATWMAAKCEQNRWYNTHPQHDDKDIHPGKYYEQMKASFKDTKYYDEVIEECGYFKTWANR